MLKLGCMSLSYKDEFAANKLDLEQFIERAYQLGLDGIDIHTRAFTSLDPGLSAQHPHAGLQARNRALLYRRQLQLRQTPRGTRRRSRHH